MKRPGSDFWASFTGRRRGWSGWSPTCCGWRGSTPARRPWITRPCDIAATVTGVVADLEQPIAEKQMRVRLAIPDEAAHRDHRRREDSRHPAEPDRERGELHAGRRRGRGHARPSRQGSSSWSWPIPVRGCPTATCSECSSASIAWTSRAPGPAARDWAWRSSSTWCDVMGGSRDGRQSARGRRHLHRAPAVARLRAAADAGASGIPTACSR